MARQQQKEAERMGAMVGNGSGVGAGSGMNLLLGCLTHDDLVVRAEAGRLLGEVGSARAVGLLVDYVRTDGHYAKMTALRSLVQIGDRSVVDDIAPLVDDPKVFDDWYWHGCKSVRAAAAVALLGLGSEAGVAYLEELAEKDDDSFYAWFAAEILRMPAEFEAVDGLQKRLTVEAITRRGSRGIRTSDPGLLCMEAEALGALGEESGREKLEELLKFRSRYVRGQAALSLVESGANDARLAMIRQLAEGDVAAFARMKASFALWRATGDDEWLDRIRSTAAAAEEWFEQAAGVELLGQARRASDVPYLLGHLEHEQWYVRACAVEALDRLGAADGEAAALKLSGDESLRVRMQVGCLLASREEA